MPRGAVATVQAKRDAVRADLGTMRDADVALRHGVSRGTVSAWKKEWAAAGQLAGRPRASKKTAVSIEPPGPVVRTRKEVHDKLLKEVTGGAHLPEAALSAGVTVAQAKRILHTAGVKPAEGSPKATKLKGWQIVNLLGDSVRKATTQSCFGFDTLAEAQRYLDIYVPGWETMQAPTTKEEDDA